MSWSKPSRSHEIHTLPAASGRRPGSRALAAWLAMLWLAGCSSMDDRALSTRGEAAKGGAGTRSNDLSGAGAVASDGGSAGSGRGGSKSQSPGTAGSAGMDATEAGADSGGAAGSAPTAGTEAGGTQNGGTQSGGANQGGMQAGGNQNGGTQSGGTNNGGQSGSGGNDNGAGGCGDLDNDLVQDCTQTLVDNARFDSVVTPWRAESGTQQSWDAKNARPVAGSGALKVNNTLVAEGNGQTLGGSGQCLPAEPNKDYLLAARTFIPKDQGQGSAGLSIWFFGADNCADYLLPGTALELVSGTDAWQLVSKGAKSPPATRSIYVRLVTSKPFSQPSLEALFDDVLLREQ
jgi:hypothetical protein